MQLFYTYRAEKISNELTKTPEKEVLGQFFNLGPVEITRYTKRRKYGRIMVIYSKSTPGQIAPTW